MADTAAFSRIAIVNRGEPAMRLINAVEEINAAEGTGLRTIALYTDPDRRAMFVRRADEAYHLGPATFTDENGNRQITYLDYSRLEQALVETGADAVWVGWGFVAEHADFAAMCERRGITFIGPSSAVMRRLGDKITSKQVAESSDVPVAAWSGDAVATFDEALAHAERLGYPLLIKATAGGGGRGIRRVESAGEIAAALDSARAEARNAFGNEAVFLETLVPQAKHIEVQIIGDSAGTVWAVGVRDCSVQRKNQKILEEAPSPALSPDQDRAVREAAARLGAAAGYSNAGTVEFLFDPEADEFWFMEVNARLQVEHPVTELTTGVDMVKLQLHVARGGLLDGDPPATVGHAIEARVNAEDPDAGFTPAPGRIELLRLPTGPGLRVDTGVEEGDEVAAEFDSMIAKLIAFGRDRDEALARLRRGLANTGIIIRNGTSNKAFLQSLLAEPQVVDATADVGWVDRMWEQGHQPMPRHGDIALIAAAIDAYREQQAIEIGQFRGSAFRGRPEVDVTIGRSVSLRYAGDSYNFEAFRLGPNDYRVDIDGHQIYIHRDDLGRAGTRLEVAGSSHRVLAALHGVTHLVEVDGHQHRIAHDEGGILRSPAPAVVVSIDVDPGTVVEPGDRLAVIEAMKMETAIEAEFAGVVDEILVHANAQVGAGAPLMVVRPTGDEEAGAAERVSFHDLAVPAGTSHDRCVHYLDAVRNLLLGFDIDAQAAAAMSDGGDPCEAALDPVELRRREDEILGVFADVAALFRRRPDRGDELDPFTRRTTEEYLFDYLRRPESRGRELPEPFVDQLRQTLSHYGIDSLEPTGALDRALFRIIISQRRMRDQLGPLLHILENRLEHGGPSDDEDLRVLLERIIDESRHRWPAVHDLASELSYQAFDQPFLDEINLAVLVDAEAHLDALATPLPADERNRHIQALVDCARPLKTMLSDRFAGASTALRAAMVEVMTRRYYRIRPLENLEVAESDGLVYSRAQYDHDDGARIDLLSTHVEYDELADAARALDPVIGAVEAGNAVVLDIYVWRATEDSDIESTRSAVEAAMSEALGHRGLRRIVVAISAPSSGPGMSGVTHVTLRPDGDGGYRRQPVLGDMHPMMVKRLELWRLDEFELEEVTSPEDLYVFHARAHDNPRDERLFAMGEVRDLTPIRDDDGALLRVPEAERMIHEVFGAIRRYQAQRPTERRLQSNRAVLYVWPTLDLTDDELHHLVSRLAPDTEGLGLQKVQVLARVSEDDGPPRRKILEAMNPSGLRAELRVRDQPDAPVRPLEGYDQKVARLRQRGLSYPYEITRMLAPERTTGGLPPGRFVELDLEGDRLVPVERPPGQNEANIVVGLVTNTTTRYPDGMERVILLGDPSRGMGNLAEPECSRIMAALDLAAERGVPLEWFAVSAGALIAMDSGTENMDWIGKVLRRIVEFTQAGGEVNIIVTGINVGAQPYWNAEATMLMHTSGILVMLPESAMVLTGKDALDFSGGVSAEDNVGIGGYERIMGPNGQAQYFAPDLPAACRLLLQHYEYTYLAPGERFAPLAATTDPVDRDIRTAEHGGQFETIGDVFDEATNPGRKQPFEIRRVMEAVVDADQPTLERWYGMRDAEIAVVWDAFLGGRPVSIIGFESKNLQRAGLVPADGPENWTSGTLFPRGSQKVARAINAASGNRPLVVLANLSGFDGSPESMRKRQLEFGAEIGRAVVNFDGPIIFCVVSRYHGGAFVVFSGALNDNMEIAALEGSVASVIGGAPAAAVVFAREVRTRAAADERVVALQGEVAEAEGPDRIRLTAELAEMREQAHADKLGEVAAEFDAEHDIRRAERVGSVDRIIPAAELRPYLVDAVERGIARAGE